jgi:hypothetical protein
MAAESCVVCDGMRLELMHDSYMIVLMLLLMPCCCLEEVGGRGGFEREVAVGEGGESSFPFSANMNAGAKAGFEYRRLGIMRERLTDIDTLV